MERKVIKGVDKTLLTEINRSREIMGLGQLIREADINFADSGDIETWLRGDGSESSGAIRNLVAYLEATNLDNQNMDGSTVWDGLNAAFEKITGDPIVECPAQDPCQGTKVAFAPHQFKTNTISNYKYINWQSSIKHSNYALLLQTGDDGNPFVTMVSSELGYNKDDMSLEELFYDINTYNIKNAGGEQIWRPAPRGKDERHYKARGGANALQAEKNEAHLILWTYEKSKINRDVNPDYEEESPVIAGDVLNAPLADSYDDLVINIKDMSAVNDIKAKIAEHLKKPGGTVDSITITSTASNTGLQDSAKADFATMMTKAGFSEYANVSSDKGSEGDFTIDEVDTTDEALAVARGKLLAKLLGYGDDDVTYKFAITSGPKTVNVHVQGNSDDQQDDPIKHKGSSKDEDVITKMGSVGTLVPGVIKIQMLDRNLLNKFTDWLGTSKGAKRRKKA